MMMMLAIGIIMKMKTKKVLILIMQILRIIIEIGITIIMKRLMDSLVHCSDSSHNSYRIIYPRSFGPQA